MEIDGGICKVGVGGAQQVGRVGRNGRSSDGCDGMMVMNGDMPSIYDEETGDEG